MWQARVEAIEDEERLRLETERIMRSPPHPLSLHQSLYNDDLQDVHPETERIMRSPPLTTPLPGHLGGPIALASRNDPGTKHTCDAVSMLYVYDIYIVWCI